MTEPKCELPIFLKLGTMRFSRCFADISERFMGFPAGLGVGLGCLAFIQQSRRFTLGLMAEFVGNGRRRVAA